MYKIYKYWIDNYELIKDCIWLHVNKNARLLLKESLSKNMFLSGHLELRLLNENKFEWTIFSYKATALYIY